MAFHIINELFYISGEERKTHLRRVIVSESRLSLNIQEHAVRNKLVYKLFYKPQTFLRTNFSRFAQDLMELGIVKVHAPGNWIQSSAIVRLNRLDSRQGESETLNFLLFSIS